MTSKPNAPRGAGKLWRDLWQVAAVQWETMVSPTIGNGPMHSFPMPIRLSFLLITATSPLFYHCRKTTVCSPGHYEPEWDIWRPWAALTSRSFPWHCHWQDQREMLDEYSLVQSVAGEWQWIDIGKTYFPWIIHTLFVSSSVIRVIFSHLKLLNVVEFFVAPNCHFLCGHSYPPPAKSLTPNFIVNNLAFVSVDIDIFTTSAHWRYFCIRVTVCKK